MKRFPVGPAIALLLASSVNALAQDQPSSERFGWFSGDWTLTLGAAGFIAPEYDGSDDYEFRAVPMISFGRGGPEQRFSSRNDNISIALYDTMAFRAGVVGKILFPRDSDDSDDLAGLDDVEWGGEVGGFAEVYPLAWLRLRGEVRQGFSAHEGVVGDFSADAFYDVSDRIRVSAGPRLSVASADYFDAYYGVTAAESLASGLAAYDPDGGLRAAGIGGAINWKTTDRITTSGFGEYSRLLGTAADSSLVHARGAEDQFMVGLSTTYRFDFFIP